MNKTIMWLIMGVLFLVAVGSNIFLLDQLSYQKELNEQQASTIKKVKMENKALKANNDQEINKVASEFVNLLFTYKPNQKEKPIDKAQKLSTGEARELLTKKPETATEGDSESLIKDFYSTVEIQYTNYNKTGNDTAKVEVNFDQLIKSDGPDARTKNLMVLNMKYEGGSWKVENYELKQVY